LRAPKVEGWESRIRAAIERVEQERLPIVVELSGMPKLGKTVFADALMDLFRRSDCRVASSPDATMEFPVADRWHVNFSAWTLVAFVKRFLEFKEAGQQVIIADRGLFDAMAWLRVKAEIGLCDEEVVRRLRGLAYAPLWWEHQCLVLVFLASADQVLGRAAERRLYAGSSAVTTRTNLDLLRRALVQELRACNRGRDVARAFDVSEMELNAVLCAGAEAVVGSLEEYAGLARAST